MKPLYLAFLVLTLTFTSHAQHKVGVTLWPGLTNPDGTGVYLELLKEVYGEQEVKFNFTTYKRMTVLFERGNHDIVIGVYKEDIPKGLYSKWHLDIDFPVKAFFLKDRFDIQTLSDLEGLTLSWIHGYDYDKYIEYDHQSYPINTLEHGFNLLINHRTDILLDYQHNVPASIRDRLGSIEVLPSRPIYLAFQRNEEGKLLADTFDKKMLELRDSGILKKLYQDNYRNTQFADFNPNIPVIVISSNDESLLRLNGFNKLNSLESQIYQIILSKLSNYNVHFVKAQFENQKEIDSSISCFANRIFTKQRAKKYLYSKPFSFYLSPRIYSKKPFTTLNQSSLVSIILNKDLKLGLPTTRLFTPLLNKAVSEIPKSKIYAASPHVFTRLKQLESGENFNVAIEYPADISSYWQYISDKKLFSKDLLTNDEKPYTLGYLMCKKSEDNQAFIEDFNAELESLYHRPEFKKILSRFAAGVPFDKLEPLINEAFSF